MLYVWAPIKTIVILIPNLLQAKAFINRIAELKVQLTQTQVIIDPQPKNYNSFSQLDLKNISYQYKLENENNSQELFAIGPIDFQIKKGEVIFISGGNGSGKTTFINILIGLMRSDEGTISVNKNKISRLMGKATDPNLLRYLVTFIYLTGLMEFPQ